MIRRRFSRNVTDTGLSADFDRRLRERLAVADSRKRQRARLRRWRWMAMVTVPLTCAICWTALPFTFGDGVRAVAGTVGYVTMLLAVAESLNREYLSYLNLTPVPVLIDALLLIGVFSWLIWASRPDDRLEPSVRPGVGE